MRKRFYEIMIGEISERYHGGVFDGVHRSLSRGFIREIYGRISSGIFEKAWTISDEIREESSEAIFARFEILKESMNTFVKE